MFLTPGSRQRPRELMESKSYGTAIYRPDGTVAVYVDANGRVGVGVPITGINASAVLQLDSTTMGAALPRMTGTQRDAITSVLEGLLLYNSSTHTLNGHNGTAWQQFLFKAGITVDHQSFTATGSSTWNKPTGALITFTRVFGAGSGGGGGARDVLANLRLGGGGGAGGSQSERWSLSADLASSEAVVVGTGGTAGGGATTNGGATTSGNQGSSSTFAAGKSYGLRGGVLGAGFGGNNGTSGAGGNSSVVNTVQESLFAAIGGNGGSSAGSTGGSGTGSGTGGGGSGGGCLAASSSNRNGGIGGASFLSAGGGAAGAGGTNNGTAGVNPGEGGGGGGSNGAGAGGDGANGGPGGGGGGGGAGTSANGGTGGAGGNGQVDVYTVCIN